MFYQRDFFSSTKNVKNVSKETKDFLVLKTFASHISASVCVCDFAKFACQNSEKSLNGRFFRRQRILNCVPIPRQNIKIFH